MIGSKIITWMIVFMFCVGLIKGYAQNVNTANDSLRTLKILEKALKEVIEKNKQDESDILDLEIDALVMDQTMTKVGRDFYDMFYSTWEAPKGIKNYTITIKEMVLPGLATEISILVNEVVVFKQRVQPRYEILEQASNYAIYKTSMYLNNYKQMKDQLGGEDQEGSGIF